MKHKERRRNGGRLAAVALFFALVACLIVAGGAWWQRAEVERLIDSGSPERLMGRLGEESEGVGKAIADRMSWLGGVAERLAAQPDEESIRALLPEVENEWDASIVLCLLDATGEGFQADGAPVSFAGEVIIQNAINSPDQQGMDYQALPLLGGQSAVLTATAFTDATGAARVLVAAGGGEALAMVAQGDDLLIVAQRGDVVARSGADRIPDTANLLDYLWQASAQSTASDALYHAFLDGEAGVSWHHIETGWVCLLFAPIEGTNWMAVQALPGNLPDPQALLRLPDLIVKAALAAALLCVLLLCAVLLLSTSKKRRAREEAFSALEAAQDEDAPETATEAPADHTMQS